MTDIPVKFTVEAAPEDPRIAELEAQIATLDSELTAAALRILDLEESQKVFDVGQPVKITAGIYSGQVATIRTHAERVTIDGATRTYVHSSLEPIEEV